MKNNSISISTVQLHQINLSLPTNERNSLKALLAKLTGANHWQGMTLMSGYANAEIDRHTKIKLFWCDDMPDSKRIMNGQSLCIIPGSYLEKLSLFNQQHVLRRCWNAYRVSQLHLKARISSPKKPIQAIAEWSRKADKGYRNWGYMPYGTSKLIWTSHTKTGIDSPSLYFPEKPGEAKKSTVFYDPFITHGIKNAQDCEFRVSDEYVPKYIPELLADYWSDYELAMAIKSMVFDSIDFRVGNNRARWYEEIKRAPLAF